MAEVFSENRPAAEVLDMDVDAGDMDVDAGGAEDPVEGVAKRGREEEEEGDLSKRRKVVVERSFEEERIEKLVEGGGGAEEDGEDLKEGHGGGGEREREGDFKEEGVDDEEKRGDLNGLGGEDEEKGRVDVQEAVKVPAEVSVGPKIFTSSVEMFDYFYNFLHSWSPNLDVNKYEHMVLLDLLKKGHAEPETKIGEGVKAFQVRFHRTWKTRCFFVIRMNETVDEFSFRKCVDNILSLPEEMKAKAELTMKADLVSGGNKKRRHDGNGGRRGGRGGGRGRGQR